MRDVRVRDLRTPVLDCPPYRHPLHKPLHTMADARSAAGSDGQLMDKKMMPCGSMQLRQHVRQGKTEPARVITIRHELQTYPVRLELIDLLLDEQRLGTPTFP